jgi:hypothetical protein
LFRFFIGESGIDAFSVASMAAAFITALLQLTNDESYPQEHYKWFALYLCNYFGCNIY